jgi:hypothetical protein
MVIISLHHIEGNAHTDDRLAALTSGASSSMLAQLSRTQTSSAAGMPRVTWYWTLYIISRATS